MRSSRLKVLSFVVIGNVLADATAWGQTPKELKTKAGSSVVLANFLNARPDCSANPGPVAVPVVNSAPVNGVIQMQVVMTNVVASEKCPARRVASIALIYTPKKGFAGRDSVQLEVEAGNQKSSLKYNITVQSEGQQL